MDISRIFFFVRVHNITIVPRAQSTFYVFILPGPILRHLGEFEKTPGKFCSRTIKGL
jgi:hypothetical protein